MLNGIREKGLSVLNWTPELSSTAFACTAPRWLPVRLACGG
jgi:hypothetical protein